MTAPVCLPVEVRPVPGWPLWSSASGDVFGPRGPRRTHVDQHGYRYVTARRRGRPRPGKLRVHVAVLVAWVGPCPPGLEARHRNGQQQDNRVENLCWSTHVDNCADKAGHGTLRRGEDVQGAKLTEAAVREMRQLHPQLSFTALAERFGISKSVAHAVVRRRAWRHVS